MLRARRLAVALAVFAVLLTACGGASHAAAPAKRAAPPGIAAGQPAGSVDFSTLHSALSHLLDFAVERPSEHDLTTAAWRGLVAEAAREGIGNGTARPPTFGGVAATDLPALTDAFARLTAVRRTAIDPVRLNDAAAASMAASLDDTHTTFVPAAAFAQVNQREAGNLSTSTGLRLERMTAHPPEVLEVVPGSPADRAGIVAGDSVLAVNGRAVSSLTLRGLAQAIEGPDGSKLSLDIRTPGYARVRTFTVVRETTPLDLVHSVVLPGEIGYIRIREFPQQVPIQKQVAQALGNFAAANVRGIVVDLRGNPGGSLSTLNATLSLFVAQSPIASITTRAGRTYALPRVGTPPDELPPLAVLVDDSSASSSEMFAAAVQEYHDGVLVGAPTCGCLMGAEFFSLPGGAGLEVAVERVYTPVLHRVVEGHPLQPDVPVAADPRALSLGQDPQLEGALERLGVPDGTAREVTPATLAAGS